MTDISRSDAQRFDDKAAEWDANALRSALADAVVRAIIAHLPVERPENALEFGCGTGLVTTRIARYCSLMTAVDSSREMLKVLNEKIAAEAIANIKPVFCDLSRAGAIEELGESFDFVCSSMTLHHIPDTARFLGLLNGIMEPGATLAIADLDAEDGLFHDDESGDIHHGFDRKSLKEILEAAGFISVGFITAHIIEKKNRAGRMASYPVFLVTAVKPKQ
jgi:ubiquinone/menaquinone biosynthesis C-methylase UbiE